MQQPFVSWSLEKRICELYDYLVDLHDGCLCCHRFESLERCFRWSNRVEQKTFAEDWVTAEAQQQQQYRSNYYNRTGDADSESDSSASSTATQNGSSHSGGSNTSSDDCDKATSRQHSSTVSALASSLNGRPLHDDGPDLAMSGDLHGGLLEPSTPTAAGRSQAY